jgi:transposase
MRAARRAGKKWSRAAKWRKQGLANIPSLLRLIGMEARVGAHHLSRKLASLGHRCMCSMPAKYVRPLHGFGNRFGIVEVVPLLSLVHRVDTPAAASLTG